MYCNSCGSSIPDDARFCGQCGKQVANLPGAPSSLGESARARLARHLPALALLWVIYSALRMLAGGAMLFVGSVFMHGLFHHGPPFAISFFGWPFSPFMLRGLVGAVGVGVLLLGAAGVAAGWGLWHRQSWARILALILGILALLHFPLGTALGIYTLWVLLPRDAGAEFAGYAASQ